MAVILIFIAIIFFLLGRFSSLERTQTSVKVQYPNLNQPASVISTEVQGTSTSTTQQYEDGPVIGSKTGKKYYFPWCGTVKRILPKNQISFSSIADAKTAGFTPGGNCKGLW